MSGRIRFPLGDKMADKTGHDMRVSSDDTRLNEKRRGTRQAHGTSNTAREGLLVDLTDTDQQTNMHAVPQDPSDLSSREAEVSPKKTGLVSIRPGNSER